MQKKKKTKRSKHHYITKNGMANDVVTLLFILSKYNMYENSFPVHIALKPHLIFICVNECKLR